MSIALLREICVRTSAPASSTCRRHRRRLARSPRGNAPRRTGPSAFPWLPVTPSTLPLRSSFISLSGVPVRKPEVLVRVDEQTARRAGMLGFAKIGAVGVEHLDALIVAVSHVQQPLGVDRDRMRDVELARTGPLLAPGLDEVAVLVELDDLGLAARRGPATTKISPCGPNAMSFGSLNSRRWP